MINSPHLFYLRELFPFMSYTDEENKMLQKIKNFKKIILRGSDH